MATMEVEDASLQPVVQSSSAVNPAQQQQAIAFSPKFSFNNFILLEVDEKLADELLCSNNSNGLYVRGWQTDEAVLCTESTTNACREVEISNSLLILDGRPMPMEGNVGGLSEMERELGLPALRIASVTNCFVEVSAATPSGLRRLKELLEAKGQMNLFTETAEDDQNKIGISWPSLLSQMQMSEQQLVAELAKYPLVKKDKDGHFCLVSQESIWRLLDFVIELCQSTGEAKFTGEFLRSGLPESVPDDVIDWFMREYCEEADDGTTQFSLVESKVSRARVEQLLLLSSPPDKQLDFEQFEQRVNSTLPDNFRLREEHLLGLALVNQSHFHGKTLRRLLLTDMPIDLHKRLSLLFSLRHSWRKEEIQPYIMDFCPNAAKVEEFLMKHCRLTGSAADRHFVYKQLNY